MRKLSAVLLVLIYTLFLWGCSSTPKGNAPDWVIDPPREEGRSYVFVAYGTGGDDLEARANAETDLVSSIVREFGVKVTSESSSTARATLDTFAADMEKTVKTEGSARISGFFIEDTFIENRDDKVVVWVKGLYEKAAFDQEKARIRALFTEQQEAVFGPEREADRLISQGSLFLGFTKYLEAARASAASDLENERIRTERNLNSALNSLDGISLIVLTDDVSAFLGEPVLDEFRVKLVKGGDQNDPGVPGASIKVSYPRKQANGRMGVGVDNIKTNEEGIAMFKHPAPTAVGDLTVTYRLDADSFLEPLWELPKKYQDQVGAIEDKAADIQGKSRLRVESAAKTIPTGIFVLDVDKAGTFTGSQDTAGGISNALTDKGFSIVSINQSPKIIQDLSEQQVLERLQRDYGNRMQRVVIGTISIDDFQESNGAFLVTVAGSIKVIDLKSRDVLFSNRQFKRTRGSSFERAVSSAFRQLGSDLGERLASELP